MNRKILIVEDEKELGLLISYQLERFKMDTYRAANGWQGLDILQDVVPDLIITDIVMPEMDGLELCKNLDERGLLKKIPVIVLTAYANRIDEFKALGVHEFLIKPFENEKLLAAIEKIFAKEPQPQEKAGKLILLQGAPEVGMILALRQFKDLGYTAPRIEPISPTADSRSLVEEILRRHPDILILDASQKILPPPDLIKALHAYAFLKKMVILFYFKETDEKQNWLYKKMTEAEREKVKALCLEAGATKYIESLNNESFLKILWDFCL